MIFVHSVYCIIVFFAYGVWAWPVLTEPGSSTMPQNLHVQPKKSGSLYSQHQPSQNGVTDISTYSSSKSVTLFPVIKGLVKNGAFGNPETIMAIDKAIHQARNKLANSCLNPASEFMMYKDKFEAMVGKDTSATYLSNSLLRSPKGALLHAHFNAILPAIEVWNIAVAKVPDLYVQFRGLDSLQLTTQKDKDYDDCTTLSPKDVSKILTPKANVVLWVAQKPELAAKCKAGPWIELKGLSPENIELIKNYYVKHQIEFPSDHSENTAQRFARFNDRGTSAWKFLFMYESVLKEYTTQVIKRGVEDGIYWQEWRTTFLSAPQLIWSDNGVTRGRDKKDSYLAIQKYLDIIDGVIKTEQKISKFVGAAIIWSITRQFDDTFSVPILTPKYQIALMDKIRNEPKYRNLVRGIDVVGHEGGHNMNPTSHYDEGLMSVVKTIATKDIPFVIPLHAGEEATPTGIKNVQYVLDLCTKVRTTKKPIKFRIGHGVALQSKANSLRNQVAKAGIHIELAPVSNEAFKVVGTPSQSAQGYMNVFHEVSSSFNNGDDPTYQRSDFKDDTMWLLRGVKDFGLAEMIASSIMSIEGAVMTEDEHSKAKNLLKQEWSSFISSKPLGSGKQSSRSPISTSLHSSSSFSRPEKFEKPQSPTSSSEMLNVPLSPTKKTN